MSDLIKLAAPEGFSDVSFGGENYAVQDGVVQVPVAAADFLYQFGFSNLTQPEDGGQPDKQPEGGKRKAKSHAGDA